MDDEIRQLARELAHEPRTALSARKATVSAISLGDASTPPTITVDLDGTSVPDVRLAASYAPAVGDTVVLLGQKGGYVAAFKVADAGSKSVATAAGWTQAVLTSGHTHLTTVCYRRVLDHGAWKMQWKGLFDFGGNLSLLQNLLPAEYRPSQTRALPVALARGTAIAPNAAMVEVRTDGSLIFSTLFYSFDVGVTGPGGDAHVHSHGGAVATSSFAETHIHEIPVLAIPSPVWVSMDGVEYFLY